MIINRKRFERVHTLKKRGARHYVMTLEFEGVGWIIDTPVEVDHLEPLTLRWHYCSIVAQPVEPDVVEGRMHADETWYEVSWRLVPPGWRKFFLRGFEDWQWPEIIAAIKATLEVEAADDAA
jgi:hypothetical protein